MKRKRAPCRLKGYSSFPFHWLFHTTAGKALVVLYFVVQMCILASLLLRPPTQVEVDATSACAPVDPQDVGNMVERGNMVVECLQGK